MVARFCRDITAPTLKVAATLNVLWPPNHQYANVKVNLGVSDDADPASEVTLLSVTSNEPDNGADDGNTINDIVILDPVTFRLRAERSDSGTGRTYSIRYQASDYCGNTNLGTAAVSVPVSR